YTDSVQLDRSTLGPRRPRHSLQHHSPGAVSGVGDSRRLGRLELLRRCHPVPASDAAAGSTTPGARRVDPWRAHRLRTAVVSSVVTATTGGAAGVWHTVGAG